MQLYMLYISIWTYACDSGIYADIIYIHQVHYPLAKSILLHEFGITDVINVIKACRSFMCHILYATYYPLPLLEHSTYASAHTSAATLIVPIRWFDE